MSLASCHLGRNVRGGDEETALQVEITCGRWFNFKCKSSRILEILEMFLRLHQSMRVADFPFAATRDTKGSQKLELPFLRWGFYFNKKLKYVALCLA